MIREIDTTEFSVIEHFVDEYLLATIKDHDVLIQLKSSLLKDLENKELVLFAGFDDLTPSGFGSFRPALKEITAFHFPTDVWQEMFDGTFQHLKRINDVIRISGKQIPECMHDFLQSSEFSMVEYADMSIQREDVESISLRNLPDGFDIVQYNDDMKAPVAEMLFESFIGQPYTQQYPEQVGSLDGCSQVLKRVDDSWNLSILTYIGDPIGSCLIKNQDTQGRVGLVAVHPSFRERGLGRIIVSYSLVNSINILPTVEVISLTSVNNDPAFGLYRSLGFVIDSIHKTFAWSKSE